MQGGWMPPTGTAEENVPIISLGKGGMEYNMETSFASIHQEEIFLQWLHIPCLNH